MRFFSDRSGRAGAERTRLPLRRTYTSLVVSAVGLMALVGMTLVAAEAGAAPSQQSVDAINQHYVQWGGATSDLGNPTSEVQEVPGGAKRDYSGGAIFYSPQTGARVMYGEILAKYISLGGPPAIGFPTIDERNTATGQGKFSEFAKPGGAAIYWSQPTGTHLVEGKVLQAWRASGSTKGPFGFPTTDSTTANGVTTSGFAGPTGTQISWSDTAGLATVPAALAANIPGFTAPSVAQSAPTPSVANPNVEVSDTTASSSGNSGSRWWPWLLLALLGVLAAGLLSWLRSRRNRMVSAPARSVPLTPVRLQADVPAPRPAPPTPPAANAAGLSAVPNGRGPNGHAPTNGHTPANGHVKGRVNGTIATEGHVPPRRPTPPPPPPRPVDTPRRVPPTTPTAPRMDRTTTRDIPTHDVPAATPPTPALFESKALFEEKVPPTPTVVEKKSPPRPTVVEKKAPPSPTLLEKDVAPKVIHEIPADAETVIREVRADDASSSMAVHYQDQGPATGGIEITYLNNAVGRDQRSVTDKTEDAVRRHDI